MGSEGGDLFEERIGGGRPSGKRGRGTLADRKAAIADLDNAALSEVAARAAADMHTSGRLSDDEAMRYLLSITRLFPNAPATELDIGLIVWGIYNGVGSRTDYSTAPDVVIGGNSVRATKIFGEILPVTREGIPRKFYKTVFGDNAVKVAKARVELVAVLEARLAEVGMVGADISAAIDFIDGASPGTTGGGVMRAAVKEAKIKKRGPDETETRVNRQISKVPIGDVSDVTNLY